MPFHQQRLNPDRNEKKTERVNANSQEELIRRQKGPDAASK